MQEKRKREFRSEVFRVSGDSFTEEGGERRFQANVIDWGGHVTYVDIKMPPCLESLKELERLIGFLTDVHSQYRGQFIKAEEE